MAYCSWRQFFTQEACDPTAPPPAPPPEQPAPATVAQIARDQLTLTMPPVHAAPGEGKPGWVNIATWFWVDADGWTTQQATATAGFVTATVTAVPDHIRVIPGDGSPPIDCDGPGVAFAPGRTTTCSHRWVHSSTNQPSGRYTVRVEAVWKVTWSSNVGAGGQQEVLTLGADLPYEVVAPQAVTD